MTKASQFGLALMMAGVVLVGAISANILGSHPQAIAYKVDKLDEVHVRAGSVISLHDPDATRLYVVEAGGKLALTRTKGDGLRLRPLQVQVLAGAKLQAEGTNIFVVAEPQSEATVSDGVSIDATGATVYARGDARVRALSGAVIYNSGTGDEHAFAGSTTYARTKGRIFAENGSIVYAKSPADCDACTQVAAGPGSTVFVYEGAEAFAKQATVTVYKGGEVGCYHGCTLYLFPGAENNYGPDCTVHQMTEDSPVIPFPEWQEPSKSPG